MAPRVTLCQNLSLNHVGASSLTMAPFPLLLSATPKRMPSWLEDSADFDAPASGGAPAARRWSVQGATWRAVPVP